MLIHIVCWKYKADIDQNARDSHRNMLRELSSVVEGMHRLQVGGDILHLERSFDTGLVIEFADESALDRYTNHPDHLEVAALGKKISEKVVSVDFLTPPAGSQQ